MTTKETFVFLDLIGELMDKDKGNVSMDHMWMLASDCPDEEGITGWCPLKHYLALAPSGASVPDYELRYEDGWDWDGPLVEVKCVKVPRPLSSLN
jgi:hypothetical protein